MTILSHYDEGGNPVYIKESENFANNIWKSLAMISPTTTTEDVFEFPKFMQLLFNALAEIRVVIEVLDGTIPSGPISIIELPISNIPPLQLAQRKPKTRSICMKLRKESSRLIESLQKSQEELMTIALPLSELGWRVKQVNGIWKVDHGLLQILNPIHPDSPLETMKSINEQHIEEEEELLLLTIDGCPLYLELSKIPSERLLFFHQFSKMSKVIFRMLKESLNDGNNARLSEISLFEFNVITSSKQVINFKLASFSLKELTMTSTIKVKRLLTAFLETSSRLSTTNNNLIDPLM